jgi:7,8-dihydroneopterin aldolase/epimerase/oxygenase
MKVVRKAIVLREQELSVWIGVHDHEKSARQRLLVSVEVDVEGLADENDQIDRTFDYDKCRTAPNYETPDSLISMS